MTWAINLTRLQNCLITFSRQLLHLNCECFGKAGNFTVPNLAWYNKHKSFPAQVAFNLPLLQPCCHERCSPQTPITGPARHLALIVIKRRWASASRAVRVYFFLHNVLRHRNPAPPPPREPQSYGDFTTCQQCFWITPQILPQRGDPRVRRYTGNHEIPEIKIYSHSARQTVPSFLSRI